MTESKRDLGELFKERFAKAEMEPDHDVWRAIEKTLDKKYHKRGGYLWFLIGLGVLLGTLSAIYLVERGNTTVNDLPKSETPIIESDGQSEKNQVPDKKSILPTSSDEIPAGEDQNGKIQKISEFENANTEKEHKSNVDRTAPTNNASNPPVQNRGENQFVPLRNSDSVLTEKSIASKITDVENTDKSQTKFQENRNSTKRNKDFRNTEENIGKRIISSDKPVKEKNGDNKKDAQNNIAQKHQTNDKDSVSKNIPVNKKRLKKVAKTDSLSVKIPGETNQKRYFVQPFIGTSNYGGFSKASAIDSRLNGNKRASSIRSSYGVYLVFVPKEKWSIRIGAVYNQLEKSTLGVPIAPNGLNTNFYKTVAFENGLSYTSFSNSFPQREEIVLTEKLGYLEIPVEVGYTFHNRNNLGIDAIVGTGVQYSKRNELLAISNSGQSTLLGENTNYSRSSFGIHFGSRAALHAESVFKNSA